MAEGKNESPKSDKRYTFLAQPQPSSVIKDEPDLTDDQMNEMSELDVALKNLEKV